MNQITLEKILNFLHRITIILFSSTILSIIFINYFRGGYSVLLAFFGIPLFLGLLIPCLFIYFIIGIFKLTGSRFLKYSNYSYQGENKLYPSDRNFVENDTWTEKKLTHFWFNYRLACSDYFYDEEDKLTPFHMNYIPNKSWTQDRIIKYYRKCYERSKYNYREQDKLYPDDELFVKNSTWSPERIENYYWNKH